MFFDLASQRDNSRSDVLKNKHASGHFCPCMYIVYWLLCVGTLWQMKIQTDVQQLYSSAIQVYSLSLSSK